MQYPKYHKEIVNDLLEGKFLLYYDDKFQSLKENQKFYEEFFKESFDYELKMESEFAYLSSEKTDEKFSRNFTIFLAILCYELSRRNEDFKKKIENEIFSIEEIQEYFHAPNFQEVVKELGVENLSSFLKQLSKRNLIEFEDKEENFRFTRAVKLFFEFAQNLAKEELENFQEETVTQNDQTLPK
ncbi:MAG: hypothetical protein N3A69_02785 [Leptospiraceae bacterium]|nr:hypothetical protein [Leptospiraceae bacterium]